MAYAFVRITYSVIYQLSVIYVFYHLSKIIIMVHSSHTSVWMYDDNIMDVYNIINIIITLIYDLYSHF